MITPVDLVCVLLVVMIATQVLQLWNNGIVYKNNYKQFLEEVENVKHSRDEWRSNADEWRKQHTKSKEAFEEEAEDLKKVIKNRDEIIDLDLCMYEFKFNPRTGKYQIEKVKLPKPKPRKPRKKTKKKAKKK